MMFDRDVENYIQNKTDILAGHLRAESQPERMKKKKQLYEHLIQQRNDQVFNGLHNEIVVDINF